MYIEATAQTLNSIDSPELRLKGVEIIFINGRFY